MLSTSDPYFNETEETFKGWRQLTLIILPLGLLGLLLGLVGELGVRVSPFDYKIFPPMILYTVVVGYFLLFRPKLFTEAITAMLVGLSFFLVLRTVGVLFFAPPNLKTGYELAEPLFWSPIIYLFAFLIPKVHGGRIISATYTLSFVMLTVLSMQYLPSPKNWEVVQFLILVNLVNCLQFILSMGLVRLQGSYSEAKIKIQLLDKIAYVDSVTGLPNRFKLNEILEAQLLQAAQHQYKVALLFIDIDRFKLVNDTLGHLAGDLLLQQFAERLKHSVRDVDLVARINGDEFVVIVSMSDPTSGIDMIVERISRNLKEPFDIRGQQHRITASIGGCLYPDNADNAEDLLRHADSAMYKIKKSSKNGFSMFNKTDAQYERRQQLEKELSTALEQGQFLLHYQPMYDLETGKMIKLEALLRWKHPQFGFVSPLEFIPIAEESGQIISIGNWVLQEACSQARRWQLNQKSIQMSVNVSSLQFVQGQFVSTVIDILHSNNLPAATLELEITEGALMNQPDAKDMLYNLQSMGISIAIDDFGTGYSSLAYLRELPIDTIKIDKSFVRNLFSEGQDVLFSKALISTIVALAKHLDLEIVAEGIETTLEHHTLIELGCHIGQGYLFSKPLPAHSLEAILNQTATKTLSDDAILVV